MGDTGASGVVGFYYLLWIGFVIFVLVATGICYFFFRMKVRSYQRRLKRAKVKMADPSPDSDRAV